MGYMGGSKGGSQAGNYQQYMDYQKYMGGGTGNAGGQASNYQQYMDKYSGNAKPGSDTTNLAASGDYSHYYASYMPAKGVNMSNQTEVAAAMKKKYGGAYLSSSLNWSDQEAVRSHFMKEYAKPYSPKKAVENAPANPADCQTLKELKAWRASKLSAIKHWVPESSQKGPESSIDDDFEKNKARIMAAKREKAKAPAEADDADDEEDLKEAPLTGQEEAAEQPAAAPQADRQEAAVSMSRDR